MGRDSFEEVRQLPEEELRQLLSAGSNIQRVWAAWALGVRQGTTFALEAGAQLAAEPDPGVRRHLAVILAGAGDRDAVQALADHDPAEVVRTSALRLRLQMSTGAERDRVIEGLISVATSGRSESLRCEVLRILSTIPRELSAKSLEPCLADPEVDVRREALDVLHAMQSEGADALLIAHSLREPEPRLQNSIWLRPAAEGRGRQVVEGLSADPPILLRALRVWRGSQRELTWADLERAAALDLRTVDAALFEVIDDVTTFPLPFLFSRVIGAGCDAEGASLSASYCATSALAQIGHSERLPTLDSDQREVVSWLLDGLKREEAAIREDCRYDPDEEYLLEQLAPVLHQQEGLQRLLRLDAATKR